MVISEVDFNDRGQVHHVVGRYSWFWPKLSQVGHSYDCKVQFSKDIFLRNCFEMLNNIYHEYQGTRDCRQRQGYAKHLDFRLV